jgi:hypothetical protein
VYRVLSNPVKIFLLSQTMRHYAQVCFTITVLSAGCRKGEKERKLEGEEEES